MGPIGPLRQGYPYINMIIATNSVKNKAQTAWTQAESLRKAHRHAAPLGGTQRWELDLGTDVLTANTKQFAESQRMTVSDFAPGNPSTRGGVSR
jgi:hypothetical protein